jgi:multiple antibiotic resistance protein
MITSIIFAFGTLFAIVNPLSTSLVFMKITRGMDKKERQKIALKSSTYAFIALAVFLFAGQYILSFFGITVYAFRVAGGLYLLKIGFDMLSPQLRKNSDNYESDKDSIAIIPLAIPLLSGPGALTSVLVLGAELSFLTVLISIF